MIRIIFGICFILFGIMGGILELSDYARQETLDTFGIVLVGIFILTGLFLSFYKQLRRFFRENNVLKFLSTVKIKQIIFKKKVSLLTVSAIIELIVAIPATIFIFIYGIYGFVKGEMGNMIGLISFFLLLVILPYIILKAVMVYGLVKHRRWSLFLSLFFGIIYLILGMLIVSNNPLISLLLFAYSGFTFFSVHWRRQE